MLRKLLEHNTGQAAAEFGLALMVLLPLVFWMLRLGELLNMKHEMIAAARLAAWEKAYGRPETEIKRIVESDLKASIMFSNRSKLKVETVLNTESSNGDFTTISASGIPTGLKLNHDNYYLSHIKVNGQMPLGFSFTLNEEYALLADSWNLTDQNDDRKITDEDLEESVNRIYFWIPGVGPVISEGLKTVLDTLGEIQDVLRPLAWLAGQDIDIDPRGHPHLKDVPKTSGQ